jgi:hypothetical protein
MFLEADGSPLNRASVPNKYRQLSNDLYDNVDSQANNGFVTNSGGQQNATSEHQRFMDTRNKNRQLLAAYYEDFEEKLLESLRTGVVNNKVKISNPTELFRIMFFRQLEKQKTRILYIPAFFVSYFAFNYDISGRGVSLLEQTKLYSSFRAILTCASLNAAVAASVNTTNVEITLDENDPDPKETINMMLTEFVASRSNTLSLYRFSTVDILNSLTRAGVQVNVTGNANFPSTTMVTSESPREIKPPDSELMDQFKRAHYAALYFSAETIGQLNEIDFATTITSSNLFQTNRISKIQSEAEPQYAGFIQRYIKAGGPLYNKLKKLFEDEKCELKLSDGIASIRVVLPRPDTATYDAKQKDYEAFCNLLKGCFEAYFTDEMLTGLFDDPMLVANIAPLRAGLMGLIQREYIRSENIMPELDHLLINEDFEITKKIASHNIDLIKLLAEITKVSKYDNEKEGNALKAFVEKYTTAETQEAEQVDESSEGVEETEDEGNDGGDDNTGDDFGGDDDLDADFAKLDDDGNSGDEGDATKEDKSDTEESDTTDNKEDKPDTADKKDDNEDENNKDKDDKENKKDDKEDGDDDDKTSRFGL